MLPQKPSLFIVDDEPDHVYLVETAARLSGEFGLISSVTDSQLAYEMIVESLQRPEGKPGLIFIDWMMPRLNGHELAVALQRHPQLRDVPIVVLSGSGREEDRDLALACGCRAFYQKPMGLGRLVAVLTSCRRKYCGTT
jgi:CheY-like chemotaxis protein